MSVSTNKALVKSFIDDVFNNHNPSAIENILLSVCSRLYWSRERKSSNSINTCRYERLKDRIMKISPDSTRAKEIIAEDKSKVNLLNRHIQSLGPESEVAKVSPRLRKREYRYG